ncbi:hypothetical protein [Thiomonas sp.]
MRIPYSLLQGGIGVSLLFLSGCAWLNPPAPKPVPPVPIPATVYPRVGFSGTLRHFRSEWHLALIRTRQATVACAKLDQHPADPTALACWRRLSARFQSEADWLAEPMPTFWLTHAARDADLRRAQADAVRFFREAAPWATQCGADFRDCYDRRVLRTLQRQKALVRGALRH